MKIKKPKVFISQPMHGKSLELMADADVVYFAEGWQKARGCRLEYECARAYKVTAWMPLPEAHEEE